jgi:molecular chaperone Hsp33
MVLGNSDFKYKCNCTKAKFHNALATLKHSDLQAMIDEDNGAETVCKFCGKKYEFSAAELQRMIDKQ